MGRRTNLGTGLATLSILLAVPAEAQSSDLQRQWADRFLAAYDIGTPQAFEQFCDLYQTPPNVEAAAARRYCAGYLYRYRLRYGPVRVVQVEERPQGPRHWLEGTLSGAVFGVTFMPTETTPPRIDGASVMQGLLPPGYSVGHQVAWRDAPAWLDRHFQNLTRANVFSGMVLVARGDSVVYHRAFGLADEERRTPNDLQTRFRISSVGKMITAMTALSLVEAGKIDLDSPIARYYPEYPASVASQVTLRHLLTHTSGLEIDDYAPFVQARAQAKSLDGVIAAQIQFIEHMNEGRYPNFRPLGSFDYSNENLDLVGGLIQRLDGNGWEMSARNRVMRPAAADGIQLVRPGERFARGYSTLRSNQWSYELNNTTGDLGEIARPAGSEYATAMDLFRFMRFVEGKRRASPLYAAATQPLVPIGQESDGLLGYGLGFEAETHPCFRSYGHGGAESGVSASARHYPDQDVTIIVLANRDGVARDSAGYLERVLLACQPDRARVS